MVKVDDEITTQHHSADSEGKMDFRTDLNTKGNTSPSNSSESSFISGKIIYNENVNFCKDSDSDNENETKKKDRYKVFLEDGMNS